jgi:hypothetical protein
MQKTRPRPPKPGEDATVRFMHDGQEHVYLFQERKLADHLSPYAMRCAQKGTVVCHTAWQPIPFAVGVTSLRVLILLIKACPVGDPLSNGKELSGFLRPELLYLLYRIAKMYTPLDIELFFGAAISSFGTATPIVTKDQITKFIAQHASSVRCFSRI